MGFDHSHLDDTGAGGHARFSRFGLGRAQGFAFAKTNWRTSTFAMEVDIKHRGLNYTLTRDLEPVTGCRITGELYELMSPSQVALTVRGLTELARYVPVPLYVNGDQVNTPPQTMKWDHEDEVAYYRFRDRGGLTVYNLGTRVCEYPASRFGAGGLVVSKTALELNTARTDILQARCTVWPTIEKAVKAHARTNTKRKSHRLTEAEREHMVSRLIDEGATDEILAARIITDVGGRHHPLSSLRYGKRFTVADRKGSRVGDRLHRQKIAFVLCPSTLDRFGVESGEALAEMLSRYGRHPNYRECRILTPVFEPFEDHAEGLSSRHELVADKELKANERAALRALRKVNFLFARAMFRVTGERCRERKLSAGASDSAHAWTDGTSYIGIERRSLRRAGDGVPGLAWLVNLLLHEYCHADPDTEDHDHDQAFYETFEAAATTPGEGGTGRIVEALMKAFPKALEREGVQRNQKVLRSEDYMAAIEDRVGGDEANEGAEQAERIPA